MDLLEKTAHLVHLYVCGAEDFRTWCEVIDNSDGKNLKADELFQFFFGFFIIEYFGEVVYCIFIFVGELPPVWAHLADAPIVWLFETVGKGIKFFVNQDEVVEVQFGIFRDRLTRVLFLIVSRAICTI